MCCTAHSVLAQICTDWKEAVRAGQMELQLEEASGVAVSRKFPGRMYHINDSGDAGRFFMTNMEGKNTTAIAVPDFAPEDAEAMSLGGCAGTGDVKSCLFIGDIGDNGRRRQWVEVVAVEEVQNFGRSAKPRQRFKLRYPDGPHDAESLAVHPNGTIYMLTKDQPARLFKFNPREGSQTLTPVMKLDTPGRPTDMTISDDGTRLLVLTYRDAVEFGIDFDHPSPPRYRQVIRIRFLEQQEGVAYLPGSHSFIYTSERVIFPAWIMRVDCGGN